VVVITDRDRQDDRLHDRYGRQLAAKHAGKFVAISDDGQLILGSDELALTQLAVERFGAGNYALRRIGAAAEGHALIIVP
jgi:hypothetical protein